MECGDGEGEDGDEEDADDDDTVCSCSVAMPATVRGAPAALIPIAVVICECGSVCGSGDV